MMKKKMIARVLLPLVTASALAAAGMFILSSATDVSGQDTGWMTWMKTSPCAGGRTDWITVARENPTMGGGGGYWELADSGTPGARCTSSIPGQSCTFAQATAAANLLRQSSSFASYCCRDYSVWENSQTKALRIVKGMGTAGFGWMEIDSGLCCEEAEEMVGKTGLCGGVPANRTGGVPANRTSGMPANQTEMDIDRPGGDYRAFDLEQPSIEACRAACAAEGQCRAFTYVKPGVQGPKARCWLKSTVPPARPSNCCVSEIMQAGNAPQPAQVVTIQPPIVKPRITIKVPAKQPGGQTVGVKPAPLPVPPQAPAVGGRWQLVSITASPPTPNPGWAYNPQSGSAQYYLREAGGTSLFQWTQPPQSLDGRSFPFFISVTAPNNQMASLIGVSGSGFASDTPSNEQLAYAKSASAAPVTAQKTITFTPQPNAGELEIRIGLMWGSAGFTYKYKRVQ